MGTPQCPATDLSFARTKEAETSLVDCMEGAKAIFSKPNGVFSIDADKGAPNYGVSHCKKLT